MIQLLHAAKEYLGPHEAWPGLFGAVDFFVYPLKGRPDLSWLKCGENAPGGGSRSLSTHLAFLHGSKIRPQQSF